MSVIAGIPEVKCSHLAGLEAEAQAELAGRGIPIGGLAVQSLRARQAAPSTLSRRSTAKRNTMTAYNLLRLARETVNAVPTCLAITIDGNGDANARAINTSKLTDEWTVRFITDRRTRKVGEIARTGRMTLVYFHQAGGAYVTLVGRARIIEDVAVKQTIWQPGSFKWHPGGPTDPNVVLVEFMTERIETWNTPGQIVPDPTKGLWAAVLTRDANGWRYAGTSQEAPFNTR
jgi:general stress protein 26